MLPVFVNLQQFQMHDCFFFYCKDAPFMVKRYYVLYAFYISFVVALLFGGLDW